MKWACLLFLLVLSSALRFGAAWSHFDAPASLHGEEAYFTAGRNLASLDGSFSLRAAYLGDEAFRASLYPSFIALVGRLFPPLGAGKVRLAQAALGSLTVLLLFALGARVHSPLAGFIAACLLAVNPTQTAICADVNIHVFFSFLVLLVACCLTRWLADPSAETTAWLGLSIGVSLACRSTLVALPLALLVWLARAAARPKLKKTLAAILVACCAAPLAPWTLRNAWRLREFVPLERHASTVNLYTASLGMVETLSIGEALRLVEAGSAVGPEAGGDEHYRQMRRLIVENIVARPGRYLFSCARRLLRLAEIECWDYFSIFGPLILIAAALGAWRPLSGAEAGGATALLLYFFFIHAPMSVNDNYLVETIPLACLLAGCAAAWACARASAKWSPRSFERFLRPGPWDGRGLAAAAFLAGGVWAASVVFLSADLLAAGRTEPPDVLTGRAYGRNGAPAETGVLLGRSFPR